MHAAPPQAPTADVVERGWPERIASGDSLVFEEIVWRYRERIARLVYRLLGWSDEAEDVIQEVFASVFAKLAELDRARLDVAQRVIDFYGQWREQQRALASAEADLRLAEQRQILGRPVDDINRARERVEAGRARLRELEAQLPFLLGRPPGSHEPRADGPDEQELAEQLATTAESALDLTQALLQVGRRATVEDVYRWSRRIVDARRMLPGCRSELAAALRAHHDRMEVLVLRTTEMRDKGAVYEGDLAASRYYLLEAKLWMVQAGLGTDLSEDESG